MTTFPGSPRLIKAGIVLVDPTTSAVRRVIPLQYNPDTLTRSFQVRQTTGEAGDRVEALRLTGPPVETLKLDAEIDATDRLEHPDREKTAVESGIQPELAALEMLLYPTVNQIQEEARLADAGTIEIAPVEAPLALFVWSKDRVLPVRITELTIVEEAFDPALNPIRAKVSMSLRVLSVNDLPGHHRGSSLFLSYHRQKEKLATKARGGTIAELGLSSLQ